MTAHPDHPVPTELSITRTFDAPRDLVWEVWTNPQHAQQWWGPAGFTAPVFEADLRVGGECYIEMCSPEGNIFPMRGVYDEVRPPERLQLSGSAETVPGRHAFNVRTTVTFEAAGDKTKVIVQQSYSNISDEGKDAIGGANIGWNQMLDKFTEYLSKRAPSENA